MLDTSRLTRARAFGLDALALILGTVVVGILSGAEQWATANTPDSEFYGSLGVFGSEVTDRATTSAYYWTRLGYIGPIQLLTSVFGIDTGQAIFRLLLILASLTAFFLILRPRLGRVAGILAATVLGVNSVVLSFFGNSYVTGIVIALSMLALTLSFIMTRPDAPRMRSAVGGILVGFMLIWVLMCNPYAAILLLSGILFMLVGRLASRGFTDARTIWAFGLCLVPGAAMSYVFFIEIGARIFPGLDWLATYRYWNSVIRQSDYLIDAFSWRFDNALLVPALTALLAIIAFVIAVIRRGKLQETELPNQWADDFDRVTVSALLICGSIVFALIYVRLSPGVTLEWTQYQAMLWAPALVAFTLVVSVALSRLGNVALSLVLIPCLILAIAAGHWGVPISLDRARLFALALVLLASLAFLQAIRFSGRSVLTSIMICTVLLGLLPAGFQVLQNSRRSPFVDDPAEYYSNAFLPNVIAQQTDIAQSAESWLISRTTSDDVIMTWIDADWAAGEQSLLPLASYQLDGPNRITSGRAIEANELQRAIDVGTTVIAMYSKSVGVAAGFRAGLPTSWRATDPECRQFPWPDPAVPIAHVCLTRIRL